MRNPLSVSKNQGGYLTTYNINYFISPAQLSLGQETMEEEVLFRRTGALLPPKEKWFTSPELLELYRPQGREYLPLPFDARDDVPSSYDARAKSKFFDQIFRAYHDFSQFSFHKNKF